MSAAPQGAPILHLRQAGRVHGEGARRVQALDGVDLAVAAGEFVAIMGPSGSGKSTLLNLAGGLDSATSGEVFVEGVSLAGVSAAGRAELRRRSVGYVFQDFNLLPGLTAAENVAFPLELDGWGRGKAFDAARGVLGECGIAELADRRPEEMSGGQRSASRSPGRSSGRVACCSPTSRRGPSTAGPAPRSSNSCGSAPTAGPR